MKNRYYIIIAVITACIFTSCKKDKFLPPDKNKYIYEIPQVNITADVGVGAYFTPTTSTYWDTAHTGTPQLGSYTTTDPVTMIQHALWADEAGVDFFVFNWNNTATDDLEIAAFLANRAGANVKMVINYSIAHLNLKNDEPLESDPKVMQMMTEFSTQLLPYLQDAGYYTIGGKPVVMITPLNLSSSALTSANYSVALPKVRQEMEEYGLDLHIIGEFTNGWIAPVNYPKHNIEPFESVTVKDWSTNDYDRHYGYFSFIDINWANWKRTILPWGTEFTPCIFPSYNNRFNVTSSTDYLFGQNGSTANFTTFCNVAKRNMGGSRLVLINSWNDYRKGTNLEPSVENMGNFLSICKSQFKVD